MARLTPRPYPALGYPTLRGNEKTRAMAEQLVFVFDTHRTSMRSPTGPPRHLGLHVALHPERPDVYYAVLVSRGQLAPTSSVEIEPHRRLEDALEWVNDVAATYDADGLHFERPNAVDATIDAWQRALETHPANPQGLDVEGRSLDDRLGCATERFLALYQRYGGWRYHGRPDATDPAGYAGPVFWQEEDVRFRLAYELEREFPSAVHLNSLLAAATVADWHERVDGKHQYVDILLDDLRGFLPGDDALDRFAARRATAMVEIRFIRRRRQSRDVARDVDGVFNDAMRLGRHLRLGRASRALMVVVDDDDCFSAAREAMPWPAGVELVHARPPKTPTLIPRPWGTPADELRAMPDAWSGTPWTPPPGYLGGHGPALEYEDHIEVPRVSDSVRDESA